MAVPPIPIDLDTSIRKGASHPAPRVKLPELKQPVIPGSNSWAQSEEHQRVSAKDTQELQPTNRDRFENTTLPETSTEVSKDTILQQRRPIQPAIPLFNTIPPNHKNRAVTDPVPIRSVLGTRKPSISQLKKKGKLFEFSSSNLDLSDGSDLPHSNVPPKALALLGVRQGEASGLSHAASRNQIPVEPQYFPKRAAVSPPKPARQIKSDPAPARLPSNDRETESSTANVGASSSLPNPSERREQKDLVINFAESQRAEAENSNGSLRPPPIAAYGSVGKQFGVVQHQTLHPSESFRGIIETASPAHTEDRNASDFEQQMTPSKSVQREPSGEILRPTVYSSSGYNGVWEHDPAVGHTLPPFSPMPKTGHPDHEYVPGGLTVDSTSVLQNASMGNEPQETGDGSIKIAFRERSGETGAQVQQLNRTQSRDRSMETERQPPYANSLQPHNGSRGYGHGASFQHPTTYRQHGLQQAIFDSRTQSVFERLPLPSANSWAPSSSTSSPPTSAQLPPRWPALHLHNPVPSPPASQQNYQRSSPLSAGLAQLDMTLHHHIDSIFNSLSRQISNKHDQGLDQLLLRIDNFEDKISKEVKGLRADSNSIRKEISRLRAAASENTNGHVSVVNFLQTLDTKLEGLENHINEVKCKGHINFVERGNIEANGQRPNRRSTHRRTESAHGSLGGSLSPGDQCLQLQPHNGAATAAASRSSSKARQSGNSNGSRVAGLRSRVASGSSYRQADEVSMAVDWATRREKTAGPDLRDHPAHRQQEDYAENEDGLRRREGSYAKQSLGEGGWYHQAYGKGS